MFGVVGGAINDMLDAAHVIEVARREKSKGTLDAGSRRESGLASLFGGWLHEKMEIRINDEETKRKEGKQETKMI